MRAALVETPVPCPKAFESNTDQSVQSQAALLLFLGRELRGDAEKIESLARASDRQMFVDTDQSEDFVEFPVPHLPSVSERSIDLHQIESRLRRRYEIRQRSQPYEELLRSPAVLVDLAKRLYARPSAITAAELMEAALHHPAELVRVAAASSYFHLSPFPERLEKILASGTRSPDQLTREVAATSLAQVNPAHARLREMTQSPGRAVGRGASNTSTILHGTFARDYEWWQPGGDFHSYLLSEVKDDLYGGKDRFGWSGGYSDDARKLASTDLVTWITEHEFEGLDIFAHSHGGSLVMLATNLGMRIGSLILLSCPVHIHKYLPAFELVKRVVSIHVHMDLVLLADRAGLKFKHTQIYERILPVWFDHSATHYPSIWQKYDVPSLL